MTRELEIDKAASAYSKHHELYSAFTAGSEWADTNRWVSVEDALPVYGVLYDIVIDGISSGIGIHNGKKWFGKTWDWDLLKEHDKVTHFAIRPLLPIPEPPKPSK